MTKIWKWRQDSVSCWGGNAKTETMVMMFERGKKRQKAIRESGPIATMTTDTSLVRVGNDAHSAH